MKRMDEMFKNAWHNVRGISSEEMLQAAEDAQRLYGDSRKQRSFHPSLL